MLPLTDSVTLHMNASPGVVWELVTDVTRIGEFSPETLEGRWVGGATGPAVGARFQGHVKRNGRGPMYWTTCAITRCEAERDFAFTVEAPGMKPVNTWRYQLVPSGDGTDVTESFTLTPSLFIRTYWTLFGGMRSKTNRRGMTETLNRIKTVAEKA